MKKSSALIYTLLFTALVAMMAFAAGKLIIAEMQQGAAQEASIQAYNLANTAIEEGIYQLTQNGTGGFSYPNNFVSGDFAAGETDICDPFQCAVRFYICKPGTDPTCAHGSNKEVNPTWAEKPPTSSEAKSVYTNSFSPDNRSHEDSGYYDIRIYNRCEPHLLTSFNTIEYDCAGWDRNSGAQRFIVEGVGYYKGYKRVLRAIESINFSDPPADQKYTTESIIEIGSAS